MAIKSTVNNSRVFGLEGIQNNIGVFSLDGIQIERDHYIIIQTLRRNVYDKMFYVCKDQNYNIFFYQTILYVLNIL